MNNSSVNIFNNYIVNLNKNKKLNIVLIDTLNYNIKQFIEHNIIKVMYGSDNILGGIGRCKANFLKFISSKEENKKIGFIAEFFVHLYLLTVGYNQEFILKNLEDNSFKKGFDGVYSRNNEIWIAESKSGNNDKSKIKHQTKILDSIKDLNSKIAGKTSNDPWMNALNHLKILYGQEENDIKKIMEQLSYEYDQEIEHNIDDFNTIYASTIFYGLSNHTENKQVEDDIKAILLNIKGRYSEVICINYKIFNEFIQYLQEG